jgi:hypothetical protein
VFTVESDGFECERCGAPFVPKEYELLCSDCLRAEAGRSWPDWTTDRIIHGLAHFAVAALLVWVIFVLLESCHVIP